MSRYLYRQFVPCPSSCLADPKLLWRPLEKPPRARRSLAALCSWPLNPSKCPSAIMVSGVKRKKLHKGHGTRPSFHSSFFIRHQSSTVLRSLSLSLTIHSLHLSGVHSLQSIQPHSLFRALLNLSNFETMSPNAFSLSSALCLFLALGPATVLSAPQLVSSRSTWIALAYSRTKTNIVPAERSSCLWRCQRCRSCSH